MLVVVPTDDGKTVKLGHFGDAKYYLFYELSGSGAKLVKKVENPYKEFEEHVHGVEEKRKRIFEIIKEADVVVYTFFGPGGEEFMKRHGKKPFRVEPRTEIEEALRLLRAGDPSSPVGDAGFSSRERN